MLSTAVYAAMFVLLLAASLVLFGVFLRLGLQWARIEGATWGKIGVATAAVFAVQIAIRLVLHLAPAPQPLGTPRALAEPPVDWLAVAELATVVLVPCVVIMRVFTCRFVRALQAWLPTLIPSAAVVALALMVLRPYVFEAFTCPTSPMAPTLVGVHWRSACSECGQPSYCTAYHRHFGTGDSLTMICENFHVTQQQEVDQRVFGGDRFLTAKFLEPRRWDVIVFQYPKDPTVQYAMRLVGLPGETIHIEEGAVWANGERLTPPESLRGIEYLSSLEHSRASWGTADRPATLGDDEYFVLGDFSAASSDSRLWSQGAAGHNPFAVPKSHVCGVVTHIYWPPRRWRILR